MSYSKDALLNFEEKYVLGPVNLKTGTRCWDWTASKNAGGYGYFKWRGVQGYAHRFAYEMWRGPITEGRTVDHDDPVVGCGRPSCVNPDHLALATPRQQKQRQRGVQKNNRSGFRGVSWSAAKCAWVPCVQKDGKKYYASHIGLPRYYGDVEQANSAAASLRAFLHKEDASE